jgi:uncharacterized phiE125 gp8 family phage protein
MAAVEARVGRALLARRFSWTVTRWREDASQGLPIGPITAIEAVVLVGPDGTETIAEPESYALLRTGPRPRLIASGGRWLPRVPRGGHAEIRFVAGFGVGWDSVPADLRQAVFLLAAHYYENRAEAGQAASAMPFGVLVLLEAYRSLRVGGGAA